MNRNSWLFVFLVMLFFVIFGFVCEWIDWNGNKMNGEFVCVCGMFVMIKVNNC